MIKTRISKNEVSRRRLGAQLKGLEPRVAAYQAIVAIEERTLCKGPMQKAVHGILGDQVGLSPVSPHLPQEMAVFLEEVTKK